MARPKKIVDENEPSTAAHEGRLKEAARKKESEKPAEIKEEWYSFGASDPQNKKGRKVIRNFRTEAGVMTVWVGWEKKIPIDWIKKTIKKDMFKNLTSEDTKRYGG